MKYTDEQIEKAKSHFKYGIECDIFQEPVLTHAKIALDALDLINRQEAEIDYWKRNAFDGCMERGRIAETARSEAIKEFAERLKEKSSQYPYYQYGIVYAVSVEDIDNLVKEMVGESNG